MDDLVFDRALNNLQHLVGLLLVGKDQLHLENIDPLLFVLNAHHCALNSILDFVSVQLN